MPSRPILKTEPLPEAPPKLVIPYRAPLTNVSAPYGIEPSLRPAGRTHAVPSMPSRRGEPCKQRRGRRSRREGPCRRACRQQGSTRLRVPGCRQPHLQMSRGPPARRTCVDSEDGALVVGAPGGAHPKSALPIGVSVPRGAAPSSGAPWRDSRSVYPEPSVLIVKMVPVPFPPPAMVVPRARRQSGSESHGAWIRHLAVQRTHAVPQRHCRQC